jgi:hypothetical protein
MSNDKSTTTSRQGKEAPGKPVEVLQNRGGYIPPLLHELLATGKLSGREAALFLDIQGFKRNGCWVSKRTFADKYKVSQQWVKMMIAKLKRLGLLSTIGTIEIRGYDMRILGTNASTEIDERGVLELTGGNCDLPPGGNCDLPQIDTSLRSVSSNKLTPSGGCGGRSMKKEKGALIPAENTSSTKDEWSIRCAERLRDIAINKMFRLRSYSPTSWAKKFARLRASLGGEQNLTEKHIEAVLEWYSENWEEVKAKPACASSWCREDLFNLMSDKMEQAGLIHNTNGAPGQSHTKRQKGVDCSNKRLTIPDDVREQLDEIEWARGEPAGLDEFYFDTVKAIKLLESIAERLDEQSEECTLLGHFLGDLGTNRGQMAMRWCRWAAASANAWPKWGGSLKPFRLHPDGNLFKERLNDCRGRCLSGTVNRLIATLKKEWA